MATRFRDAHGFTFLELAAAAAIFAILVGCLLNRVSYYEEQAERASVEQTLGILRGAMHLQMADRLLHPASLPMSQLAGANPMNWLAEPPPNYVGEYAAPRPGQVPPGNWYFDINDRTLIYVPNFTDHLQTAAGEKGKLRFRSRLTTGNIVGYAGGTSQHDAFDGVALEPVKPYKWF